MRPTVALLAAVAFVSPVAACASGEETRGAPTATPSATVAGAPPALTAPELETGFTEVLSQGPVRGSHVPGPVRLEKGVTWLAINCVADSGSPMVDVVVDSVATFSTDCRSGEVSYYAHELNLAAQRKPRIAVKAPDTVWWTLSVQGATPVDRKG